jgi:hypothetical protein
MRYSIDYQYMPKYEERPLDQGEVVGIEVNGQSGPVLIPEVGDYVHIDNLIDGGQRTSFSGRVRTRLFSNIRTINEVFCSVTIVVGEEEEGWHRLINE